ncbi:MAG: PPC domain-containing protein [Proteobacteria bacterium]|nr:PPC domain-containing protein [Pseudomonadota bacterium]
MMTRTATRVAIFGLLALGACTDDEFVVNPIYNHANGRVVVKLSRGLEDGEQMYVRSRRGTFGTLDCAELATHADALVAATPGDIEGPYVDPALTKAFYGPEWATAPTPEMLAALKACTDSIIDVCIMNGGDVVRRVERDLFAAWDAGRKAGLGGKADDPHSGEVTINSPEGYGERCVAELGEIPFFEKLGDGSYGTYSCLDSTAIPMTVTHDDGTVDAPQEGTVNQCDNPQYIYSLCEAGPRVANKINEQGTRWTLLCRKSIGGYASDQFNDIAMIGHNPFTGKTCFFQNALYSKTDGGHVPHPADKEKSKNLWSGVHGGIGSGIQCSQCHDADPFIHTPWIDGAKDTNGRPIVPKMGVDADLALGALDTPYDLVNLGGQHWTMEKQLVSAEANACLKCHRMGAGRWADSWIARLGGTDTSWTGITTAKFNLSQHKYWMPPDTAFAAETDWASSEFKSALDFIAHCGSNPADTACVWKDVPHTLGGGASGGNLRNPVAGTDDEIAQKATTVLGMNKTTPSQQCAECHAPNQTTLRDWQDKTEGALANCFDATGGEARTDKFDAQAIAHNTFKTFGPFDVASGSKISVKMTGTGDADLYVKRGAEATEDVYDCRPYGGSSDETCDSQSGSFNATGPAKFWVGVKGYADATVNLVVTYKAPGGTGLKPKEIVDCMRLDPTRSDSPFAPSKLGIYASAAHLGWFQDTFKGAYPDGQNGNTADTWALEYGKFKNRTSMPKGNHPRFSQEEFDVVAEWFARGLPRLTSYIAADNGPTSCTPNISAAIGQHATAMASQGWSATNKNDGMNMFGCGGATSALGCLTGQPEAASKPYGRNWAHAGVLRMLRELSFNTYYWMRSSPDGRFIANGATGGDGGVISDLQTNKDIKVKAAYDPGFFPDGKGWVFQGTPIGAGFCTTGLLTSNPDRIDFSETQCSAVGSVSLYQHLGAGLNGGDYMVINSQFTSDNPSGVVTHDPSTGFAQSAQMKISPMMFDGTHYVGKPPVAIASPFEGDSVLSPSTKLIVSRFGNEGNQLGYIIRKVTATPNGPSYDISTQEVGRYCVQGAKPAVSFDERFMVFHHYVGESDFADLGYASAQDPAFRAIVNAGSSNIVIVDLVTGTRTRVTTMAAGQYALFPHFRSDGWIYFLVRDKNSGHEYAVASDAALR